MRDKDRHPAGSARAGDNYGWRRHVTMATQVERNARYMRRLREARDGYERLLRRVRAVEAERDHLRLIARERLDLLREQVRVWRGEMERREAAATEAMIDPACPWWRTRRFRHEPAHELAD